MNKLLVLCVGLLLAEAALAATATISYQRPTTYENGTTLPASAITGYKFICTTGTTADVVCTELTLPGAALSGTMNITVPTNGGTACISGVTFVGVSASQQSNIACKTFAAVPPGPPQNVTVAVVIGGKETPVYTFTSANARIGQRPAGFIDLGVVCDGQVRFTWQGDSYRHVPSNKVRWWDTTPNWRVAAPCRLGQPVTVEIRIT